MSSLDKAIIGRIDKGGERFEVLLDREKAYAYLEGKKKELEGILIVEEVFKDARKGERQSSEKLLKAFGTTDVLEILREIFEKGEIQLTTEQRRKMVEEKRKRVMDIILRNAVDVRTRAPIPPQRLELAMEEAKVHIDPFKPAEKQVEEVVKAVKLILPLRFEKARIAVKIPAAYAAKAYSILKRYDVKQEGTSSGDLLALLEVPAGIKGEVIEKLSKATNGEVSVRELEG